MAVTTLLTILIPAYNEEANLSRTVHLLIDQIGITGWDFEIVIVNDCSRDRTGEIAESLSKESGCVRAVHHPSNRGIGGGFVSGVSVARGDWMILIPADLALAPSEIKRYLDASKEADVVVGVSSARVDYSPVRQVISWLNIRLIQVLFGMTQRQFNYISLYRLDALRQITIEYWQSAFFFAEILIKLKRRGMRLVEQEVEYAPRFGGASTGANWKLILKTGWDMMKFRLRL